jgi:hypothetical protein
MNLTRKRPPDPGSRGHEHTWRDWRPVVGGKMLQTCRKSGCWAYRVVDAR